ncbi:hypothetical protein D9757_000198 [Collybiopsis confluens]|uniref:Uncharacterized protein n=1 Tax=Collybiopsis confluens TaxID=2823264 RepID=A0A8H5MH21_9AGAR|nr:hypothetical protein D9757_000198 [Collybiopsis confluens]
MTATTTATIAPSAVDTNNEEPSAAATSNAGPKHAHTKPAAVQKPSLASQQYVQAKKAPRRSQPIINWFQRKLAGTARAKRLAETGPENGIQGLGRPNNRIVSSPLPSAAPGHVNRPQGRFESMTEARRKTISLNGDGDAHSCSMSDDGGSSDSESLARRSAWSPRSVIEADEDASLRPLPPSSPPSPSPSRSSSSYLSDPRTFRSIAASTKPTTLLSVDLHGNGMGHIAEAPITPNSQFARFPHVRTSSASTSPNVVGSGASITFSALPPSPQSSSRPSSTVTTPGNAITVQAPLHTTHHPRNNPRPSSPPMDNASMLTLASSAYAIPGLRVGMGTPVGWSSAPPSAVGGGADSVSHFEGTFADAESQNDNDEEPLDDRDVDASLRALRPRSTRRGSWESEASRWSARGTPSLVKDRSVWRSNSVRTGALSTDHVDVYEKSDEASSPDEPSTPEDVASPSVDGHTSIPQPASPSEANMPESHRPSVEPKISTDTVVTNETVAKPQDVVTDTTVIPTEMTEANSLPTKTDSEDAKEEDG